MDYNKINPKAEPLTIERLKKFKGCEHYSDQEAEQIIESLGRFASICFHLEHNDLKNGIDNQHIVSLEKNNRNNVNEAA